MNKEKKIGIFKTVLFISTFFIISPSFAKTTWSAHGGALIPIVKEVDNIDPFFGGGLACEVDNWRFTFDVYGTRVKENLDNIDTIYADVSAQTSSTELIFTGTVDYLLLKPEKAGFFAGVGIGFGYERLNFKIDSETTIAGQTIGYSPNYNWSEASAVLTAVAGIKFDKGEIFVRGILTPQYENVQGAVIVGAGFKF